jgi:hypothetical protein
MYGYEYFPPSEQWSTMTRDSSTAQRAREEENVYATLYIRRRRRLKVGARAAGTHPLATRTTAESVVAVVRRAWRACGKCIKGRGASTGLAAAHAHISSARRTGATTVYHGALRSTAALFLIVRCGTFQCRWRWKGTARWANAMLHVSNGS